MTIAMTDTTIVTMGIRTSCCLLLSLLLAACNLDAPKSVASSPNIQIIDTPCQKGGEGNLFATPEGELYLSWVEYVNDSLDELRFAHWKNEQWTQPQTIASGTDWFVNWADFPALVANGEHLAAHWLQKSASGTYDYDVHIAQSLNAGNTWSPSFVPHTDSIAAEHGFVSMLPLPNGRFFATWLDGRNTKTKDHQHDKHTKAHEHHTGAMTLRTTEFDSTGQLFEAAELDNRICDCCQTAAALTAQGPIIAYRDRSEEEVRDIAVVRKIAGIWTAPKIVHEDNWLIKGCPVNGPAIAATGNRVALAWFTAASNTAQVKLAFSSDAGETFQAPIVVDADNPVGRVDVLFGQDDTAIISWIGLENEAGQLNLAKIHPDTGLVERIQLAAISAGRGSGFPRMERLGEQLFIVWTDVEKEQIKTLLTNVL